MAAGYFLNPHFVLIAVNPETAGNVPEHPVNWADTVSVCIPQDIRYTLYEISSSASAVTSLTNRGHIRIIGSIMDFSANLFETEYISYIPYRPI